MIGLMGVICGFEKSRISSVRPFDKGLGNAWDLEETNFGLFGEGSNDCHNQNIKRLVPEKLTTRSKVYHI